MAAEGLEGGRGHTAFKLRKKLNRWGPTVGGCPKTTRNNRMNATTKPTNKPAIDLMALVQGDPVSRFLANGGSWADAIELEYSLQIPNWEAQLKATATRKGPSAERHRQRLVKSLNEAYTFIGKPADTADKLLASYLAADVATGKPKPAPKAEAKPPSGGKPKAPKNAWSALADSDSD
jgi:hypothetical protein